jgi:hypothetical protein
MSGGGRYGCRNFETIPRKCEEKAEKALPLMNEIAISSSYKE